VRGRNFAALKSRGVVDASARFWPAPRLERKCPQPLPAGGEAQGDPLATRETKGASRGEYSGRPLRRGEARHPSLSPARLRAPVASAKSSLVPPSPAAPAALPPLCRCCGLQIRARVGWRPLSLLIPQSLFLNFPWQSPRALRPRANLARGGKRLSRCHRRLPTTAGNALRQGTCVGNKLAGSLLPARRARAQLS